MELHTVCIDLAAALHRERTSRVDWHGSLRGAHFLGPGGNLFRLSRRNTAL
jgi:hypothetical protein